MQPLDQQAILNSYRGWIRKTAGQLIGDGLQDDLAQEGWIAAWRALQDYDPDRGALPAWLTKHAYWRMCDCARDKTWLGRPPRHTGSAPARSVVEYPSSDDAPLWDLLTTADLTDSIQWAYHRGQIAEAVNRLSPAQRTYVYLRFWRGYQLPDLKAEFGYDPTALWSSPRNGAKLKLRASLAALSTNG